MKNISIERSDYMELFRFLNVVGISTNDKMEKRNQLAVRLRLLEATKKYSQNFTISLAEATTISEALELLYDKPFKVILYENETKGKVSRTDVTHRR